MIWLMGSRRVRLGLFRYGTSNMIKNNTVMWKGVRIKSVDFYGVETDKMVI
jgi:hypothetical protein